jgi:hypothetical protein
MNATLIREEFPGFPPHTSLYRLDVPLYGFDHLLVCATPEFGQTFIVGSDAEGGSEDPTMVAIYHSEYVPHETALAACGYEEVLP